MKNVLITIKNSALKDIIFSKTDLETLSKIAHIKWIPEDTPYSDEAFKKDIQLADAVITSWGSPKITESHVKQAPNLEFIGHAAGTVVPIVNESIYDTDIVIVNANRSLARSTAEHTMALMMAGSWQHIKYNRQLKLGQWCNNGSDMVMGVSNRKVGLIGYGEISREVIRLLKPYNPDILMHSEFCTQEQAAQLGIQLTSLENIMSTCDIISLHNTLTPESRNMIDKNSLSLIKDGALLINTARAHIIVEEDLIESLKEGRYDAAIDVYHSEPLSPDYPLLNLPNVFCTPHIGGFSKYHKTNLGGCIIRDYQRFLSGEPMIGQITREKYKRMTPK